MSRTVNRKKNLKKQLFKALLNRKPTQMENHDLYVLTCTECHRAFPPRYFRGQCMEFRMCESCKKYNPEICTYLEKYIYQPQLAKNWSPFQVRLDRISQKCDLLKVELEAFKRQYCGNARQPVNTFVERENVDTKAEQLLQSLIQKCSFFEEELLACQQQKPQSLQDDDEMKLEEKEDE